MIEWARDEDTPEIREIWEEAFPEEPEFNDWFFANRFKPQECLVLREDGVIKAMAQQLPYTMEGIGEVSYIYGAATRTAYRGQGLMHKLINRSFILDRERGRGASILIPQSPELFDFYKTLGYETIFYAGEAEVSPGEYAPWLSIREAQYEDIEHMDNIYRSYVTGSVERSTDYWRQQMDMFRSLGGSVWVFLNGVDIMGYGFYNGEMVHELFAVNEEDGATMMANTLGKPVKYLTRGWTKPTGMIHLHHNIYVEETYLNLMYN